MERGLGIPHPRRKRRTDAKKRHLIVRVSYLIILSLLSYVRVSFLCIVFLYSLPSPSSLVSLALAGNGELNMFSETLQGSLAFAMASSMASTTASAMASSMASADAACAVPAWLEAAQGAALVSCTTELRLLSAATLHSRRAALGELQRSIDTAMNACHSELQRRPSHSRFPPAPHQPPTTSCLLLTLKHDEFGVIVQELCDPAQPRIALQLSSTSRNLRLLMGARLAELREQHEDAKALAAILRTRLSELPTRTVISSARRTSGHTASVNLQFASTSWRALGDLARCQSLPSLTRLSVNTQGSGGDEGVALLAAGLGVGCLPSLHSLHLSNVHLGPQGAAALASALNKRAVPLLKILDLTRNPLGDAGINAIAPCLRELDALQTLWLGCACIGDEGAASLSAALRGGALPSLKRLCIEDNPASQRTQDAAQEAAPLACRQMFAVRKALSILFIPGEKEEIPRSALQEHLRGEPLPFSDAELDGVLLELEDYNEVMFRDGFIYYI